jgi:hypothetical protein
VLRCAKITLPPQNGIAFTGARILISISVDLYNCKAECTPYAWPNGAGYTTQLGLEYMVVGFTYRYLDIKISIRALKEFITNCQQLFGKTWVSRRNISDISASSEIKCEWYVCITN